jgi:hypothetical protein
MSIELITIIGAGATILAGFGGAALGAYFTYKASKKFIQVTHNNAIDLMRRQEFNKAAATFRVAFLPELIYLKHNARIDGALISDGLNVFLSHGYFHRHLKAFNIFSAYLSPKEREGINTAWQEYCHYDIEGETEPHWAMYAEKIRDGRDTKELALERIEKILKFAEPK